MREEIFFGFQFADPFADTHGRETLLVYLPWLQQEIYLVFKFDSTRENSFEQGDSPAVSVEGRPAQWRVHD